MKPEDESSIRYGMIGFGKSPDKTTVACMYVMFWAKFEFANDIEYHQDTRSILWGLGKWTKTTKTEKAKVINEGMIRQLKNFFRFKALEGFMKEGIIDRINYVPTIDDIDDINK